MEIKVEFENIKNLTSAFQKYPDSTLKELRTALRKSLRDIADYAKQNHRFTSRSHDLERSITPLEEPSATSKVVGKVFLDTNIAKYGPIIHEGRSEPWEIRATHKKLLRFVINGKWVSKLVVTHPGLAPDPFLYKAAEAKQVQINDNFNEAVKRALKGVGL